MPGFECSQQPSFFFVYLSPFLWLFARLAFFLLFPLTPVEKPPPKIGSSLTVRFLFAPSPFFFWWTLLPLGVEGCFHFLPSHQTFCCPQEVLFQGRLRPPPVMLWSPVSLRRFLFFPLSSHSWHRTHPTTTLCWPPIAHSSHPLIPTEPLPTYDHPTFSPPFLIEFFPYPDIALSW